MEPMQTIKALQISLLILTSSKMNPCLLVLSFFAANVAAVDPMLNFPELPASVSTAISEAVDSINSKYTITAFEEAYSTVPYTDTSARDLMEVFLWFTYMSEIYSVATEFLPFKTSYQKWNGSLFYTPGEYTAPAGYAAAGYVTMDDDGSYPRTNGTRSNVSNSSTGFPRSSSSSDNAAPTMGFVVAGGFAGLVGLVLL